MNKESKENLEEVRSTIMRLSVLLDPVGLTTHIVEESKYGKRKHPRRDRWGYTRDFMSVYAPHSDPDEVIQLFVAIGAHDDHQAARWLLKHDKLVP
jgi:hypothetical protein